MGNFNRNNRSGGNRNFGGGKSFGRSQMHDAVCDKCGNDCQVPFRPTGDKPIYCSNCFEKKGGSAPVRFGDRKSGRDDYGPKKMFDAVCDKCGKDCEVPFKPTGGKPVFCKFCFDKSGNMGARTSGGNTENFAKQFEILNAKLDQILKAIGNAPTEKKKSVEKPVEKVAKKEKKVVAKKAVKKAVKKAPAKKAKAKAKKK